MGEMKIGYETNARQKTVIKIAHVQLTFNKNHKLWICLLCSTKSQKNQCLEQKTVVLIKN